MDNIRRRLGFDYFIDFINLYGLMIWWNQNVEIKVLSKCNLCMDVRCR